MRRVRALLETEVRKLAVRLGRRFGSEAGVTLIETIVALAVVGVLALVTVPWMSCTFQKGHFSQVMEDLRLARGLVESYEAELGAWPPDLAAAFGSRPVPDSMIYCTGDGEGDEDEGGEDCAFFESNDPSVAGYMLSTQDQLARCVDVRMVWLQCCGEEPRIVRWGEEPTVAETEGAPVGGG
jgi:prepilin-type N-terminal cleavage/methylation domain-containing protein